jgi:hypothetical protein
MGCDEHLRAAVLELLDQRALPIRLETTLDFIDERNWFVALALLCDGEGREAARSGAPTRQGERDTGTVGGKTYERGDGSALTSGDRQVEPGGEIALPEGLIKLPQRRFRGIAKDILNLGFGQLVGEA